MKESRYSFGVTARLCSIVLKCRYAFLSACRENFNFKSI